MGNLARSATGPGESPRVPAGARVLRRLPGRAVWREGRGPQRRVVKAFRRRGVLRRLRDAGRARAELAVLRALRAAGAPVPLPLGFELRDGAACAVLAWLPGARPLERWLAPWARLPLPPRVVARRVGEALARLHAAGLAQPDWHLENLLLDRRGNVFAVDFHRARVRLFAAPRALAELASLGGEARERAPARLLLTALAAWLRALPASAAAAAGGGDRAGRRALARRLDGQARRARLERVERDLDRWSRPSGRVRVERIDGDDVLVARGLDVAAVAGALAATHAVRGAPAPVAVGCALPGGRRAVALGGPAAAVAGAWETAARLREHRLPGLAPLARSWPPRARGAWALFERSPDDGSSSAGCRATDLARGLADRGLAWSGPAPASALDAPLATAGPPERAGARAAPLSPGARPRAVRVGSCARRTRSSRSA